MMDFVVRSREAAIVRRNRAARPVLEGLEERLLMYTPTGDHFAYSSRITWSIMPDGTSIGGGLTSNLVSTLNHDLGCRQLAPAARGRLRAVEQRGQRQRRAGRRRRPAVRLGQLPAGQPQRRRHPDRGVTPRVPPSWSYTLLPPVNNGGGDAGDIFFNTAQAGHINSDYDFETVAVHEIGHAVAGLGESTDPNAAEYEYYNGIKQGLATQTISLIGIQAVSGGPKGAEESDRAGDATTSTSLAERGGRDQVAINGAARQPGDPPQLGRGQHVGVVLVQGNDAVQRLQPVHRAGAIEHHQRVEPASRDLQLQPPIADADGRADECVRHDDRRDDLQRHAQHELYYVRVLVRTEGRTEWLAVNWV